MLACLSRSADPAKLLIAALASLLFSVPGHAAGDCSLVPSEVHTVLDQFLMARRSHAYSGTLLLEQSGRREFITAISQPGDSVTIRRMNTPESNASSRFPLTGMGPDIDACDIGISYRTSLEAGSTVAGRSTWRVIARPRDTLRYGYVMDLDRETGLPLRVVSLRADGQIIERVEFATFEVEPVTEVELERVAKMPPDRDDQPVLGELPAGFRVVPQAGAAGQTVFSDGLTSASLFLEPLPDALTTGEGSVRHGSTLTYTRGVRKADEVFLVTVIGEIPVTTARLLALAVQSRGQG